MEMSEATKKINMVEILMFWLVKVFDYRFQISVIVRNLLPSDLKLHQHEHLLSTEHLSSECAVCAGTGVSVQLNS